MSDLRIFLGNPPWEKDGLFGIRAGTMFPRLIRDDDSYRPFPFSLALAASYLEKAGYFPRFVDGVAENLHTEEFIYKVQSWQPDIVFLESSIASLSEDIQLVKLLKDRLSEKVKINLYSPHFLSKRNQSAQVADTMRDCIADLLLGCEEDEILRVIEKLKPGKTKDSAQNTPRRKSNKSIWPSRHQLPIRNYRANHMKLPRPNYQILTRQLCSESCIFCPYRCQQTKRNWIREAGDVADEIQWAIKTFNVNAISFSDPVFHNDFACDFLSELIRRNLSIEWSISTRLDWMETDLLSDMAKTGLKEIKYEYIPEGIYPFAELSRKQGISSVDKIMQKTKELNICSHLVLLIGLPFETHDSVRNNLTIAKELNPDYCSFNNCIPLPGTPFGDSRFNKEELTLNAMSRMSDTSKPFIGTGELSVEDLNRYSRELRDEWLEFSKSHIPVNLFKSDFIWNNKQTRREGSRLARKIFTFYILERLLPKIYHNLLDRRLKSK